MRESLQTASTNRWRLPKPIGRWGSTQWQPTPPFYYPLSDQEIEAWYQELADAVPVPLLLYNIPQTTHLSIPLDAVERLVRHANIFGIKDSANDAQRLDEPPRRSRQSRRFFDTSRRRKSLQPGTTGRCARVGSVWAISIRSPAAPCMGRPRPATGTRWSECTRQCSPFRLDINRGVCWENPIDPQAMMAERGLCGPTMLPPLRTHERKP